MQSTNQPAKFLVPFAQNDSAKVEIPATSSDPTRFSQSLGSPPLTGMPPEAGGVPPQLEDFNGAMNQLARGVWWALGGGRFAYDGTWATDSLIGGYARGAVLPAALGAGTVGMGEWYNNAEANTADPDATGTGWVPGYHYGTTALTGQTGGTVTLTPAQAAKRIITVAGTLTSNLVLVLPGWIYSWRIVNNTGGAFTVTAKNAATTAVEIPQNGAPTIVNCDGTQVSLDSPNIAPAVLATQPMQLGQATGRLLGVQRITASGTYTPSTGTRRIIVEIVGGGGAGGGVPATTNQAGSGSGGGSGGYAQVMIDPAPASASVTIGAGGVGVGDVTGATAGTASSFGAYVTVGGGQPGVSRIADSTIPNFSSAGGTGGAPTVNAGATILRSEWGSPGTAGTSLGAGAYQLGGEGGYSPFGNQATRAVGDQGANAPANTGAGGGGATTATNNPTPRPGGSGGSGVCLVWEYA